MRLSSAVRTGNDAEVIDASYSVENLLRSVATPIFALPARMALAEAMSRQDGVIQYRLVHNEAARLGLRAIQLDAAARLALTTSDQRWIEEAAILSNETGALLHQADITTSSER